MRQNFAFTRQGSTAIVLWIMRSRVVASSAVGIVANDQESPIKARHESINGIAQGNDNISVIVVVGVIVVAVNLAVASCSSFR